MRDCVAFTVPNVAVEGTTTDIAELTVLRLTVPLVKVELRKSNAIGFKVAVKALEATDAVIGSISYCAVGAVLAHVVPLLVSTLPDVLGAIA
jgi:hypothetical protein